MSACSKLPLDVFRPMFNPDTFHTLFCDNGTEYYAHPEVKFLRCCKPSGWRPWSDDRPYTKEQRKREIERLALWCDHQSEPKGIACPSGAMGEYRWSGWAENARWREARGLDTSLQTEQASLSPVCQD